MTKKDLRDSVIGKRYGELEILEYSHTDGSSSFYKCLCHKCGNECTKRRANILNPKNISCGCHRQSERSKFGSSHANWEGYGGIGKGYISRLRSSANRRGLEIAEDLTPEYLWNLYLQQNEKCAISGIQLSPSVKFGTRGSGNASLDRIDNTKGYIRGNVQWVDKTINAMRLTLSVEDFISTCKKVVEYNDKIN